MMYTTKKIAIALIALLLSLQTQAQNTIYSNDFATAANVSNWTLSNVNWNSENNGRLVFAQSGSYAIMPALPAGAKNMQITISAIWGNYIALYVSPDGNGYTEQGLFMGSSSPETASKTIPDGTRYIKFTAREGTGGDVFLISVTVTGNASIPANTSTPASDTKTISEAKTMPQTQTMPQTTTGGATSLSQTSGIVTDKNGKKYDASEIRQLVDFLNLPSLKQGETNAQAFGYSVKVTMNNIEEWCSGSGYGSGVNIGNYTNFTVVDGINYIGRLEIKSASEYNYAARLGGNLQIQNFKGLKLLLLDNPFFGEKITVKDCPSLEKFSLNRPQWNEENKDPQNMRELEIKNCPMLKELYIDCLITKFDTDDNFALENVKMSQTNIQCIDFCKQKNLNNLTLSGNNFFKISLPNRADYIKSGKSMYSADFQYNPIDPVNLTELISAYYGDSIFYEKDNTGTLKFNPQKSIYLGEIGYHTITLADPITGVDTFAVGSKIDLSSLATLKYGVPAVNCTGEFRWDVQGTNVDGKYISLLSSDYTSDMKKGIFTIPNDYKGVTVTCYYTASPLLTGDRGVKYIINVGKKPGKASNYVAVSVSCKEDNTYKKPTFLLTVVPNDASLGSVSGGGSYEAGTKVPIAAVPKAGAKFVQWKENDRIITSDYIMPNHNAQITAIFETEKTETPPDTIPPLLITIPYDSTHICDPNLIDIATWKDPFPNFNKEIAEQKIYEMIGYPLQTYIEKTLKRDWDVAGDLIIKNPCSHVKSGIDSWYSELFPWINSGLLIWESNCCEEYPGMAYTNYTNCKGGFNATVPEQYAKYTIPVVPKKGEIDMRFNYFLIGTVDFCVITNMVYGTNDDGDTICNVYWDEVLTKPTPYYIATPETQLVAKDGKTPLSNNPAVWTFVKARKGNWGLTKLPDGSWDFTDELTPGNWYFIYGFFDDKRADKFRYGDKPRESDYGSSGRMGSVDEYILKPDAKPPYTRDSFEERVMPTRGLAGAKYGLGFGRETIKPF